MASSAASCSSVSASSAREAPFLDRLLKALVDAKGSDLHLAAGCPPLFRCQGEIQQVRVSGSADDWVLEDKQLRSLLFRVMSEEQRQRLETVHDLDFPYEIAGVARFRGNAFIQHRGAGAVFRVIPGEVPTADALGLPEVVRSFARLRRGLVLVTGPTGSGKSTTLAALIDLINRERAEHILTIEDPIEFVHRRHRSLVNQREVGTHTESFASALRGALRQDPDVILVGEMRDPETIQLGLTAAETGHLVFGTLHTNSAAKTVDRMIDSFPGAQQNQVRSMLSETLVGVVAQQLLRRKGGGRVAAYEILVGIPAVANLIREAKTFQLASVLQTQSRAGMCSMAQSVGDLLNRGEIDRDEAVAKGFDPGPAGAGVTGGDGTHPRRSEECGGVVGSVAGDRRGV